MCIFCISRCSIGILRCRIDTRRCSIGTEMRILHLCGFYRLRGIIRSQSRQKPVTSRKNGEENAHGQYQSKNQLRSGGQQNRQPHHNTNMDAIVGLNTLCRAIISKASHLCRKNRSGRCLCQNSASGWRIPQAVRW